MGKTKRRIEKIQLAKASRLDRLSGSAAAWGLLLAIAVLVAFHPALFAEFVNWDDDLYVYENPHLLHGLDGGSFHWALTETADGNWLPLTRLSLLLDYRLFGLRAWGFHLTNVLLHVVNGVLAFVLLRGWTGQPGRSWVAAALFALHPLRVESVAWVAERKDVLSVCFGLLALLAYTWYVARPGVGRYLVVLLTFVLSLLAKPMLVTLPCLLLLLDYWPLRRWQPADKPAPGHGPAPAPVSWRMLLAEKMPLLALTVGFSALTFFIQQLIGAVAPLANYPLTARTANAIVSYFRYLKMSVFPVDLAPFYPRSSENITAWRVGLAAGILAAVSIAAVGQAKRRPALLVGWLWFLGTLVPVIGLVQVGNQAFADRYTYFPSLGLVLAFTWCAADWLESLSCPLRWRAALAAVVLLGCTAGSIARTYCWRDSITLWTGTLRATGANALAHVKFGEILLGQRQWQAALKQNDLALAIEPLNAKALGNRGMALERLNRLDEALESLDRACSIAPSNMPSELDRGVVLEKLNRLPEALASYRRAGELDPYASQPHFNQGVALLRLGRPTEAEEQFQVALKLNPNNANAAFNLALTQTSLGRLEDAVTSYGNALRLNPSPLVYKAFGQTLMSLRRHEEAVQMFEAAVRLAPDDRQAHEALAAARRALVTASPPGPPSPPASLAGDGRSNPSP